MEETTEIKAQGVMKQRTLQNHCIFEYGGQKFMNGIKLWKSVRKACNFNVIIQMTRLEIGLKGHDRFFIDEQMLGKVDMTESSWYLDESILHIILIKVARGSVWGAPLLGNTSKGGNIVDPLTKEKIL